MGKVVDGWASRMIADPNGSLLLSVVPLLAELRKL